MITGQEIIERIFQLEVIRIHFENQLMHNDREMDPREIEIPYAMLDFIDGEITWLRRNL